MTTETDKLVEMARECGFTGMHSHGKTYVADSDGNDIAPQLAAFRDRIVDSLCADVGPVYASRLKQSRRSRSNPNDTPH